MSTMEMETMMELSFRCSYIKSKEDGILYKQYDEKPAASTKDDRKGALEVRDEAVREG